MKNSLLTALFILLNLTLQAQTTNTWQGGSPNHESDWNTAANWSLGEVPNLTHNVVIPDVSATANPFPVLTSAIAEINSLKILSGAELTLKNDARIALPTSTVFAASVKGGWDDKIGYHSTIEDHARR